MAYIKRNRTLVAGVTLIVIGVAVLVSLLIVFLPTAVSSNADLDNPTAEQWVHLGVSAAFDDSGSAQPSLTSMYPARFVAPKYWRGPLYFGEDNFGPPPELPEGYQSIEQNEEVIRDIIGVDNNTSNPPLSISIPAIKVTSGVEELHRPDSNGNGYIDDGDAGYPNPVNIVGYVDNPLPGVTSHPGQSPSGWYFGHLESLGEGNVFRNLPSLGGIVRDQPVDIFIESENAVLLYRVKTTTEVDRSILEPDIFWPSLEKNEYLIYLVTCWPPRNYTQRFVVTAELAGYKLKAEVPTDSDLPA